VICLHISCYLHVLYEMAFNSLYVTVVSSSTYSIIGFQAVEISCSGLPMMPFLHAFIFLCAPMNIYFQMFCVIASKNITVIRILV
jgi:hypothetical protein